MATVTIVGSGMMGSALAFPAAENGHLVRLVGTPLDRDIIEFCQKNGRHPKFDRDFPRNLSYYQIEDLETAIKGADLIIGGVSSFGVDWFAETVLPVLPENSRVLTVTKGLMDYPDGSLKTYPALWEEKLIQLNKKVYLCAVGGPCTSYELVAHDQTEVSFCGKNLKILDEIRSIMSTSYYHISITTDITGIEGAVALKNGYALGIALTIGMNRKQFGKDSPLHYNSQAAVFGQASREMHSLLKMLGAAELESLWVGLGDLYVTVYGGRTRLIGILLGEGLDIDDAKAELAGVTLESLVVAERVARAIKIRAEKGLCNAKDYPLLMRVDEILHHAEADIPWEDFTRG